MPSVYHFNSDQFKENLILGSQQHMVAGRLCQYLKVWQLDGLRFLYKHFEKGESCILNDESGLGKVVTVSVFLGAILTNDTTKKCLIVVRDDEYIEGWRFHLNVLTPLTVKVIERTSDINFETVFLIKWSTLKNIGEITKTTFDYVIIDNRGEMLTNKFCTGILLRYYENKTSIVISSADVTANIKLLHILLRLCGRLDKQYGDVNAFEDKFQFPKLKDGVCSKVDLEDYFLKREKVINFCREFRLRRYCHQFDEKFPLVPCNEFKRHLEQWRTSSEHSQSSGSVKLLSSSSEKDTEELFKEYFQVKEERDARRLDCEVQKIIEHMAIDDEDLDVSEEVVVMSPLLFVSDSESDGEQIQVQIEMTEEVKEEESAKQSEIPETVREEAKTPTRNRRKATKPVNIRELPQKKSLRSREVASTSLMRRNSRKLVADKDVIVKRGRKPLVLRDEAASNRPKDEAINREKRATKEVENKNAKNEKNKQVNLEKAKKKIKNAEKKPLASTRKSSENNETLANQDKGEKSKKPSKPAEEERIIKNKPGEKKNEEEKEREKKKNVSIEQQATKKNEIEKKEGLRKTKAKLDEERKTSRAKKPEESPTKKIDSVKNIDKTKQAKEEENKRRRAQPDDAKQQIVKRHVHLDLVLNEAQKFINNKSNIRRRTQKEDDIATKTTRRTRTPVGSNASTSVASAKPTTSPKRRNPSPKALVAPTELPFTSKKTPSNSKDKAVTPKRSKPFTVYTPLGVHSRSTRGMQRYTRAGATQNKYMKVAVAQVGVDKISKAKRQAQAVRSAPREKIKPAIVKDKQQSSETPTVVESMQLGQAFTPTSATDLISPASKNVDYNFPLMLDKDIPDSECIVTSQSNEIIVLTGSTDNEMEPPKSTVSRRKATIKHPMVAIPRPSFNKAKSPDLFSTCSDLSLPCSQTLNNKPHFEGFKIFGSELRQSAKSRSCLDILERMLEPRNSIVAAKKSTSTEKSKSPQSHCIDDDDDAMFEITSNGTFGNIVRVNSNGEISPLRNKGQSTPPATAAAHSKNRITNYLISNNQHMSGGAPPSSSFEDSADLIPKTPKRRKSLSGMVKRSPRALSGGITGGKAQTTKLTQWLVKNSVVRSTDTPPKTMVPKRRRLDLSFPDD